MTAKRQRLLGDRDVSLGLGLEVGALHAPVIVRTEGRVLYVDYTSTEILKERFKYKEVDPSSIVDVDIIWGEQRLLEAVGEHADFAVASHVIEHVPNLIDWLDQLHAALKPGGTLGLVIPDRRYTFDAWRNDSTIVDVVEAYVEKRTRPSIRHIFEACAFAKNHDRSPAWRPENAGGSIPEDITLALPNIFPWIQYLASSTDYIDVHCWVFTPGSFLSLARSLAAINHFPWAIDDFFPTEAGEFEFHVRLKALDSHQQSQTLETINAAQQRL